MARCVPVVIRGERHPSLKAASRALGMSYSAVHQANAFGTLHRIGLGLLGPPGTPCIWRGMPFTCLAACARHLGRHHRTVADAWRAGRLDRVTRRESEGGA